MKPLVSIVIPAYNGSNYLAEAIDSALAQTYDNVEIIVVNDGSKDDGATERVALSYGDKIRYISKENGGVSSALNRGIAEMKGEYFSWLSHDDLYTPEKIENQVALITEENKNCIFMCHTSFVDKDTKPIDRKQKEIEDGFYSNGQMLLNVFSGYYISGCALLIPKKLFDEVGLFNTEIKYMQDTEMWYRMMINGACFVHSNQDGVLSRVHAMQTTVTGKHLGAADAVKVGSYMIENLPKLGNVFLKQYMFLCFRNRNNITGEKAYKQLKQAKELSFKDKLKANYLRVYGNIRPLLVKIYYKLFFRIEVKK